MKNITKSIKSNILKEEFIPDNVFLYLAKGSINFFDGDKSYSFKAGECGIARKIRNLLQNRPHNYTYDKQGYRVAFKKCLVTKQLNNYNSHFFDIPLSSIEVL